MTDLLDPLTLDRELSKAARRWQLWRRKLRQAEGLDDDPFELSGELTRRVTFDAVIGLPASDPLREPLAAWIHRLMEQRINRAALASVAHERSIEAHVIDAPLHDRLPIAEMFRRVLSEAPLRKVWLSSYLARADRHSQAVSLLWERRQEMARRLGLSSFDALDPAAAESARAAEAWLAQSEELAREWRSHDLGDVIASALGSDAARGWPARLALRTLADFFRETRLLDGLSLDTGELPRAIAASSFLRALARFGAAFADALQPTRYPFVIGCDPRGLRRRTLGALFGTLPLSPAFARRALDLGQGALRDEQRALGRVVLLESRALALRVVLRASALEGRGSFERAFQEQAERSFGVNLPKTAAGSVWRLSVDDAQRFSGLLLAAERAQALVEAHDEDWYRNPRAAEQLREEALLPPERALDAGRLDVALDSLERWLAPLLA